MNSYREYLELPPHSSLKGREELEWSNFWYDDANSFSAQRILLVGDSTARMVRKELANRLCLPVDLFATSSGLHDELFCNQIDAFFSIKRKYDVIFVQLGNHSRQNEEGGQYTDIDFERYRCDMRSLFLYLKQFSHKIYLETIFECVKPISKINYIFEKIFNIKIEKWDEIINSNTRRKNVIIYEIAEQMNGGFLDINEFMKGEKYLRVDHIHFEKKAIPAIVNQMVMAIE